MFGAFVIGLVDNILRPLLVGKDTKMPDYVVLISTLGGLRLLDSTASSSARLSRPCSSPLGIFF